MAKGVPKINKNKAIQEMSETELDSVESIAEVVGNANSKPAIQDKEIIRDNKRLYADKTGWISMTDEQVMQYQKQGLLAGHDPDMKMGLLKK